MKYKMLRFIPLAILILITSCQPDLQQDENNDADKSNTSIKLRNSSFDSELNGDPCDNLVTNPSLVGNWEGEISAGGSFASGLVDNWDAGLNTPHHIFQIH